ncbi:MAG: zinc dependent phospholipase C family protein [Saprospiraceae bacterium]|nr:zinc dependent phospholipase C family protein [Saprospiraceae bacterium]MDW8484744.1 zinc dependent phospholipase C family protein [Saprospiraceae bacterium]
MRVHYMLLIVASVALGLSAHWSALKPYPARTSNGEECSKSCTAWGFFAHRRINRLAVLTLPPEMMVFFKRHIDWLGDHATDADMRRYAVLAEGPRHYIDLDEYGKPPFADLPRTFTEALLRYAEIFGVTKEGDTLLLYSQKRDTAAAFASIWRLYFAQHVTAAFSDPEHRLDADTLKQFLDAHQWAAPVLREAFFVETLSAHGILPWHLQKVQRDLTMAFRRRDAKRILRLCADLGHYIGDAHVPLHTTSNYNGQKTGQVGIHAFWESRLPELFADEQYDYFVGKPQYIGNATQYYWNIVLESHNLVDSVLAVELRLRQSYPADQQKCPETRGRTIVLVACPDYAAAYQQALGGMVERRMRAAIQAVASAWYSAWIDAGQPDLARMSEPVFTEEDQREQAHLQQQYQTGRILGRPEEQ